MKKELEDYKTYRLVKVLYILIIGGIIVGCIYNFFDMQSYYKNKVKTTECVQEQTWSHDIEKDLEQYRCEKIHKDIVKQYEDSKKEIPNIILGFLIFVGIATVGVPLIFNYVMLGSKKEEDLPIVE